MEWSAQITNRSEVSSSGTITYDFIVLGDGEPRNGTFTVTGMPSDIQQLIENEVTSFAQAFETAESLPGVGEIIQVITNS